MYIKMNKITENEKSVCYQIEIDVWEEQYKEGKITYKDVIKYGYCTFNKETEKLELNKEKTDPYWLDRNNELAAVYAKLRRQKRDSSDYPDVLEIATG